MTEKLRVVIGGNAKEKEGSTVVVLFCVDAKKCVSARTIKKTSTGTELGYCIGTKLVSVS